MIEDTNDSVLLIVKSDHISIITGRQLLHFLTMSQSVDDQSIFQRNGQNRAFEFEMNVKPKANE